ncbi:MAG: rhomboid family intramembrane serine protease [Candidatus Omnitrophota bacterium]
MFPLRDNTCSKTFPFVTLSIIAANSLIFVYEVSLGRNLGNFIEQFALVPSTLTACINEGWFGCIVAGKTLFTSIFLHGSWMHLISNMWYLWIFGDNVEDSMGHVRFVIFYLLCGGCGNIAQVISNAGSQIPSMGASGAIAAVLGAYFLFFPGARVVTLIPIFFFWQIIEVPAVFFLGVWFIMQFLNGLVSLPYAALMKGGIAWWAHIGGFASGIVLGVLFVRKNRHRAY